MYLAEEQGYLQQLHERMTVQQFPANDLLRLHNQITFCPRRDSSK